MKVNLPEVRVQVTPAPGPARPGPALRQPPAPRHPPRSPPPAPPGPATGPAQPRVPGAGSSRHGATQTRVPGAGSPRPGVDPHSRRAEQHRPGAGTAPLPRPAGPRTQPGTGTATPGRCVAEPAPRGSAGAPGTSAAGAVRTAPTRRDTAERSAASRPAAAGSGRGAAPPSGPGAGRVVGAAALRLAWPGPGRPKPLCAGAAAGGAAEPGWQAGRAGAAAGLSLCCFLRGAAAPQSAGLRGCRARGGSAAAASPAPARRGAPSVAPPCFARSVPCAPLQPGEESLWPPCVLPRGPANAAVLAGVVSEQTGQVEAAGEAGGDLHEAAGLTHPLL